ncbi:MAG: hypothetical protein WBP41_22020 [Saprospiraceae bacterium]
MESNIVRITDDTDLRTSRMRSIDTLPNAFIDLVIRRITNIPNFKPGQFTQSTSQDFIT